MDFSAPYQIRILITVHRATFHEMNRGVYAQARIRQEYCHLTRECYEASGSAGVLLDMVLDREFRF